jgi:hypothetical protein
MKNAPAPSSGDELTGQKLLDLWAAVHELQDKAITGVQPPLVRVGETLMFEEPDFVMVKNDSGSDCDVCDVLGIDDSVVDPTAGDAQQASFETGVVISGITPATPDHVGKFVICAQPIPSGAVGRAWASGVVPVQVDVQTDGAGNTMTDFAEVDDGVTTDLTSTHTGSAAILWLADDSGGLTWALVRLGKERTAKIFPVAMSQSGGSDGDQETQATWTYDLSDPEDDSVDFGDDVDPISDPHQCTRPALGSITAATFGSAYWDDDDNLVLVTFNEVPNTEACEDDGEDDG